MQHLTRFALNLTEHRLFPDAVIRWGIRQLVKQRLREIRSGDAEAAARQETRFIEEMRRAPIAVLGRDFIVLIIGFLRQAGPRASPQIQQRILASRRDNLGPSGSRRPA